MAAQRPILIVDDNAALHAPLLHQFAHEGEFAAIAIASLEEAVAKLAEPDARFDAIILAADLRDGDGCALCAGLREQGHRMPIIVLSGSGDETDVVRALNAGANDCVAKPFNMAVLVARLRAQMRAFDNSEDAVFTIGPYTFRPSVKMLQEPVKNRRIRLTEKETLILKYLYRTGDRSVPRQTLLNDVWGYNAGVTTHTLETHIYRLRQKIEIDPANATLLITRDGGYRLDPSAVSLPKARVPEFA